MTFETTKSSGASPFGPERWVTEEFRAHHCPHCRDPPLNQPGSVHAAAPAQRCLGLRAQENSTGHRTVPESGAGFLCSNRSIRSVGCRSCEVDPRFQIMFRDEIGKPRCLNSPGRVRAIIGSASYLIAVHASWDPASSCSALHRVAHPSRHYRKHFIRFGDTPYFVEVSQ